MLGEERPGAPNDEGGDMRQRRVGFGQIAALLIPLGVVGHEVLDMGTGLR